MSETEQLEAQSEQRAASKRATLEMLRSKKRPEQEFSFSMQTADGKVEATFLFRAVSSKEWDRLVTDNPPTNEQKAEGASYNPDKFGPALLAKVCIDPELSAAEWAEIWSSPDWNKGELSELFWSAVGLCNRGLDVNPIGAVSE